MSLLLLAQLALGQPAGMLDVLRIEGWATGRPFVNVALMSRPWGSPVQPWDESIPVASYATTGYPAGQDFAGYLDLADYPTGTYAVSFEGTGKLTWAGGAKNAKPNSVDLTANTPAWFAITGT